MFICASGENFNFAKEIGIGLIESAINLTQLVLQHSPKWLIFVGSAGSYSKHIAPFSILESACATQIESSFIAKHSYSPISNKIINVSYETLAKDSCVVVNSSNYINTNCDFSNAFEKAGIQLENMEFFSILRVAQHFEIPTFGVFCVTNYCDSCAHETFLNNQQRAKILLEKYVREKYEQYF